MLNVRNLTLSYGKQPVLSGAGFAVKSGDYIGIVGPNGGGKTTLIRSIVGLHEADSGEILWDGGKPRIGYVPQRAITNDRLFPATAWEIAAMGLMACKKEPKVLTAADHDKIDSVMERLKISDLRKERIGRLSGGQQQRVLLARALASSPGLLVLDEPTSALDPAIRDDFFRLLGELNAQEGMTILLVTHDTGAIGKVAKELLYIDRRVVFFGTFDDFCRSETMTGYFGGETQHLMCGRHHHG